MSVQIKDPSLQPRSTPSRSGIELANLILRNPPSFTCASAKEHSFREGSGPIPCLRGMILVHSKGICICSAHKMRYDAAIKRSGDSWIQQVFHSFMRWMRKTSLLPLINSTASEISTPETAPVPASSCVQSAYLISAYATLLSSTGIRGVDSMQVCHFSKSGIRGVDSMQACHISKSGILAFRLAYERTLDKSEHAISISLSNEG